MGAWDAGIFDDDIAMDVEAEFEDAIAEGLSVEEATEQILESFEDELEDEDDGLVVYLVLAALQIREGSIKEDIRKTALRIVGSGQGLDRWKEAGEEELTKRVKALNELKQRLEA